jgi:26S proteasome regulatory subunit N2
VRHGAALALGLVALGSQTEEYFDKLWMALTKEKPYDAIVSEGAGYAAGMVMLGCGPTSHFADLMHIAQDSRHERTKRGVALGLAFMMYGQESEADGPFEALSTSHDPLLREAGAWVLALAYVGTASQTALKTTLRLAVTDVNPNVRRVAVVAVAFILSKKPTQVPAILNLHATSFDPGVRNGAALAIGIACAGTGMPAAIDLLKPLLDDKDEFVRQSASISMGLVLQQQSDVAAPYCKDFRALLRTRLKAYAKNDVSVFGSALGYALMNAGGRNAFVSCNSLGGENSMVSIVGLVMFCNYVYWHPLALMITVAFHPTCLIGLHCDLETGDDGIPRLSLRSYDWLVSIGDDPGLYVDPPSWESETKVVTVDGPRKLTVAGTTLAAGQAKPEEEPPEPAQPAAPEPAPEPPVQGEYVHAPCRVSRPRVDKLNFRADPMKVVVSPYVRWGVVLLRDLESKTREQTEGEG